MKVSLPRMPKSPRKVRRKAVPRPERKLSRAHLRNPERNGWLAIVDLGDRPKLLEAVVWMLHQMERRLPLSATAMAKSVGISKSNALWIVRSDWLPWAERLIFGTGPASENLEANQEFERLMRDLEDRSGPATQWQKRPGFQVVGEEGEEK